MMHNSKAAYKGLRAYTLENEVIKLVVLPELGAKIASLVYKPQAFEIFSQPSAGSYRLAEYGADFAAYDTSGADEMFPTIDACPYPYEGYPCSKLPDHGELWSIPWRITVSEDRLTATVNGIALPYRFTRTISLYANTVHMEYQVHNSGAKPLYGIWAFHGLAACDEDTEIFLPGTEKIVTVHDSYILGKAGTKHGFPVTVCDKGNKYAVNKIRPKSLNKTEKFYTAGKVSKGAAGMTLNHGQLAYWLLFSADVVPYLGVWVNEGGFKGEYNCALEPSTGYYDSLEIARNLASLKALGAGQTQKWYLDIALNPLSSN